MHLYLRYSIRGLAKNPIKSLLTILMLIIAVMLMCGATIALKNIPPLIEATLEETNMADCSFTTGLLPTKIAEQILSKKSYVKEYELRLTYRTTAYNVRGFPREAEIILIGANLPLKVNNIIVVKGRLPLEDEEAIVAEHDYGENLLDKQISIETRSGNLTVTVVGTCRAIWMPRWYGSSVVYAIMPISVLWRILNVWGMVNQILVKVEAECDVFEAMKELDKEIKAYGVPVFGSIEGNVIPFIETKPYYSYLVSLLSLIGLSFFVISLALIYTSISLMVTREFRDIGILRALGSSTKSILLAYGLRGLILGAIGSVIGALLGVVAATAILNGFANISLVVEGIYFVMKNLPEIMSQNRWIIILYAASGITCSIISAIPPVLSAVRIPVTQALRSFPGLSISNMGLKVSGRDYPYFIKYTLRNFVRRKGREFIIVAIIVVSVTINSTLIAAYETQSNIVSETSQALDFDLILCLNKPYDELMVMSSISHLMDNIEILEPAYYRYIKIGKYTVLFIGLPANATCFNYPLIAGRRPNEGENGIILPENLARFLNVKVGDNLTLLTEYLNINISVVGIRRDPIFNAAIAPICLVRNLDMSEGKINALAIRFRKDADTNNLARALRRSIRGYLWDINKPGVINILSDILTKTFQSAAIMMTIFTWMTSVLLIFAVSGQDIIEERFIIAILRALGLDRSRCILLMVFKLVILGLFSALLCLFTIPITLELFSKFLSSITPFTIPLHYSINILLNAALFILLTILPSGFILGGYIVSFNPASALRYE